MIWKSKKKGVIQKKFTCASGTNYLSGLHLRLGWMEGSLDNLEESVVDECKRYTVFS